jgi:bifunctional non-homologous end joining protein LigD
MMGTASWSIAKAKRYGSSHVAAMTGLTAILQLLLPALRLPSRGFVIDGEGVVEDEGGVTDFALLHSRQHDARCHLIGFDLLQLGSKDLRALPLSMRKDLLAKLLEGSTGGIVYSEHLEGDGADVFAAACRMGLEGIVSKRRDRASPMSQDLASIG